MAKLCLTTVRTIHLYDYVGILKPIMENPRGHRFYSIDQVADLRLILLMKDLGYNLSQIKEIVNSSLKLSDFLAHTKIELQNKINSFQQRFEAVSKNYSTLQKHGTLYDFKKDKIAEMIVWVKQFRLSSKTDIDFCINFIRSNTRSSKINPGLVCICKFTNKGLSKEVLVGINHKYLTLVNKSLKNDLKKMYIPKAKTISTSINTLTSAELIIIHNDLVNLDLYEQRSDFTYLVLFHEDQVKLHYLTKERSYL